MSKLPSEFLALFPPEIAKDITFAAIPSIKGLSEPLRSEVHVAFADSLRLIWYVMIGVSAVGLITSLPMQEISMHEEKDENWGLKEKKQKSVDLENTPTL